MHLLHQFMRLQHGDPFGRNGRQHADGDPVAPVECQVLFDQRLGSVQHHGKDLRAGLLGRTGQSGQHVLHRRRGAVELAVQQRQVIPSPDVKAVQVGVPGRVGDLGGLNPPGRLEHGLAQLLFPDFQIHRPRGQSWSQ